MSWRRSEGPTSSVALLLGIAVVLAGAGWWWLGSHEAQPAPTAFPTTVDTGPTEVTSEAEPLDLPDLSASDEFIRDLVAGLSAHPRLASWLVTDELVRRFVGVVVDLAGGLSPTSRVDFLIPEEEFGVLESGESIMMDQEGYRRYDLLTETFVSLDTRGSARLYRELSPLFEEAYAELGIPDQNFGDAMALALENLLAVQVPEEPLELQPNEAIYEFGDPIIEMRSPLEKHLIRMGPGNTGRLQDKVGQLRDAIGLEGAGRQ